MKKMISKILLGLGILASAACTKIDNYEGPNASFEGRLIDETTGENFQTLNGNIQVRLFQISWSATPSPQDIPSKADGTFKDTKLFAGRYKVIPVGGAFWPVLDTADVNIAKGAKHDFKLIPYLVIKNFSHVLDGKSLKLNFDLDAPIGAGLPTIIEVQPYVNTTKMVGPGASIFDYSDARKVVINKEWIDMTPANKSIELTIPELAAGRTFYVRVGVRVNDSFKSSNLSQIIEVKVP
jgi:hypothetical protein